MKAANIGHITLKMERDLEDKLDIPNLHGYFYGKNREAYKVSKEIFLRQSVIDLDIGEETYVPYYNIIKIESMPSSKSLPRELVGLLEENSYFSLGRWKNAEKFIGDLNLCKLKRNY